MATTCAFSAIAPGSAHQRAASMASASPITFPLTSTRSSDSAHAGSRAFSSAFNPPTVEADVSSSNDTITSSPPPAPERITQPICTCEAPTYPYHSESASCDDPTSAACAVATSTEESRIPYIDGCLSPTTGSHALVVQFVEVRRLEHGIPVT